MALWLFLERLKIKWNIILNSFPLLTLWHIFVYDRITLQLKFMVFSFSHSLFPRSPKNKSCTMSKRKGVRMTPRNTVETEAQRKYERKKAFRTKKRRRPGLAGNQLCQTVSLAPVEPPVAPPSSVPPPNHPAPLPMANGVVTYEQQRAALKVQ